MSSDKLHQLLRSDFVASFNPIREYFKTLPAWSGQDHIQELMDSVSTKDKDYWELSFRKWLVALVATAMEDSVVGHNLIVLQGPQGCGKSTWLRNLVPLELRDYYHEGGINPNNKDTLIHLAENLLIQLDELESLTRDKEAELKELITLTNVKLRRPYGRVTERLVRYASFCGSVNQDSVLNDPTGSRRFLIHAVTSIDFGHTIDLTKLYSQAYALYKNGFQYWFDSAEIDLINTANAAFSNMTDTDNLISDLYRPATSADNPDDILKMDATEIAKALNGGQLSTIRSLSSVNVGKSLTKLGFNKKMIGGKSRWSLVRVTRNHPYHNLETSLPDSQFRGSMFGKTVGKVGIKNDGKSIPTSTNSLPSND